MSELKDLIGVLGAVDNTVVEEPALVARAAGVLCPYHYGAAGWFEPFEAWVAEWPGPDGSAMGETFPELDNALGNLAAPEDELRPRDVARRLMAIAALGRVMPDYGPDGEFRQTTERTLVVPNLAENPDQARHLLRLLTDVENFPDASHWSSLLDQALSDGVIKPAAVQPLGCAGEVVEVVVAGQQQPAAAFTTHFCTDTLDFRGATAFLDPTIWPDCGRVWCAMDDLGVAPTGEHRYLEVISFGCPNPPFVKTCLEFRQVLLKDWAVVAYRRCDDQTACGGDDKILVDEGSIEVRQVGPQICVNTTKRVLFAADFNAGALAMISCALGYGEMGYDMVYNCAQLRTSPGQPFSGGDAPTVESAHKGKGDYTKVINDAAKIAKGCVDGYVDAYRSTYNKVMAGTYSSNDAASDMAKMWNRMARDAALAVDLGIRAVRVAGVEKEPASEDNPPDPPPGKKSGAKQRKDQKPKVPKSKGRT